MRKVLITVSFTRTNLVQVRIDMFMVSGARSCVSRDFDDTVRQVQQVHLSGGAANGSPGNSASKSSDSASLRRRASSWRSQKLIDEAGRNVRRRSSHRRASAKFPFARVGQRQVGPIGGVILELRLLRGGRSLVQSGDRLIDPAGPDEQAAQCVRKVVRAIDGGWHGNVGQPFLEPGDRDAVIVQALDAQGQERPCVGRVPGDNRVRPLGARTAAQASR